MSSGPLTMMLQSSITKQTNSRCGKERKLKAARKMIKKMARREREAARMTRKREIPDEDDEKKKEETLPPET